MKKMKKWEKGERRWGIIRRNRRKRRRRRRNGR